MQVLSWPSVFYIFGAVGVVWYLLWQQYAASSPASDPKITQEERSYIEETSVLAVSPLPLRHTTPDLPMPCHAPLAKLKVRVSPTPKPQPCAPFTKLRRQLGTQWHETGDKSKHRFGRFPALPGSPPPPRTPPFHVGADSQTAAYPSCPDQQKRQLNEVNGVSERWLGHPQEPAKKIPWKLLLSKKPVWALIISHFCHNWGTFILLTWMPTYYNQVQHPTPFPFVDAVWACTRDAPLCVAGNGVTGWWGKASVCRSWEVSKSFDGCVTHVCKDSPAIVKGGLQRSIKLKKKTVFSAWMCR